ncbi:MAG: TonB-dependent receptor [Gemmatimonadaceae bacterium]|nr:TonB-dependent receptor [Gemmatimonadaceae bacterium]MCW5827148.1 TonB-dependent receptor [Gemmatimonadaceae bacterium]
MRHHPRLALRPALAALGLSMPLAGVASAQATIRGSVRDSLGAPVAGATVQLRALSLVTRSDALGQFEIAGVPVGRHELTVSTPGFRLEVRSVSVSDALLSIEIVLAPMARSIAGVQIVERPPPDAVRPAPERIGAIVTTGARSEAVTLQGTDANLAEKVPRQVFARVPGILVYDMDGAGNQTNVSTRGLDPHRSWEFNVRQDGVVTNSDLYGYPASHYSPPLEAMEEVQLVRGTAALQYGSQFGGLLNYVTRAPDTTRALATRGSATTGSFGLANVYGEVGGRIGRVDYQAYAAKRSTNGYRQGAESEYDAQYVAATWRATPRFRLRGQVGRSWYRHRVPGPLTDDMFADDPRAATRERNWFSPEIVVPSLRAEWTPREGTFVSAQLSGVFGERGSVLFVGFATTPDEPDGVTGLYAPRVVDIDNFHSRTFELRVVHEHRMLGRAATLASGLTLAANDLHRRQQGPGTRGSDWDLAVSGPFGRNLRYRSRAGGAYAEEVVSLTPRWTIVPGLRVEFGETAMTGQLAYYDPADTPRRVRHDFPLFGLRTSFRISDRTELYGGWSEAYRPMLLKDILPENALERTDPAMRDSRGWTGELGLRGDAARMRYDMGVFVMRYGDRIGGVLRDDGDGPYLFKTNLGATQTLGLEATADLLLAATMRATYRGFVAGSLMDARYVTGTVAAGGANESVVGRRAEGVPVAIVRSGVTRAGPRSSLSLLVSHTSASYADARNTRQPTPNGALGLVPEHTVLDLNGSWRLTERSRLRFSVTNLLDRAYFTKRPAFYPGPGVWPSDGRAVQVGVVVD